MDKQFPTPEPVELIVQLGGGHIRVRATETDQSRVQVSGPRAEEFTVEHRGRHLVVTPPRDRLGLFGSHEPHVVEVTVPTGTDLVTKCGSADVEATGRFGLVRGKASSGAVDVETVTGVLAVDSGSGDITCGEAGREVRIRSGSGEVEVGRAGGTAAVSTGSGDVVLGRADARAVVKTGSGDISVHRGGTSLSLNSGSGSITVTNLASGEVRARTGSGDVRVSIPPGTPVWTDVTSHTGRVASDLPSVGRPAEGQDHVRLHVRTSTGDVLLAQATAGGPDDRTDQTDQTDQTDRTEEGGRR